MKQLHILLLAKQLLLHKVLDYQFSIQQSRIAEYLLTSLMHCV